MRAYVGRIARESGPSFAVLRPKSWPAVSRPQLRTRSSSDRWQLAKQQHAGRHPAKHTAARPLWRQKGRVRTSARPVGSSEATEAGTNRDREILALLIPALGSVFLDPAMQVVDTGALLNLGLPYCGKSLDSDAAYLHRAKKGFVITAYSLFLSVSISIISSPAAIVGRLGPEPLGAVGLSNLLFFFCTVFFSFLLVVTTPRVANALASGDKDQARSRCVAS